MPNMNVFRVLADVSHTASKCTLIWSIHSNRSSEGVSLLTQATYLLVFLSRYVDLLWDDPRSSWWNFVLKIFYITTSVYIIVVMTRVFARTREREKAWKLAAYCNLGTIVATPLVNLTFRDRPRMHFFGLTWTYSIILESVCVLPQLLLLRQTSVPTVIDSLYLVLLGSYRLFYIFNWIYRAAFTTVPPDPVSVVFGVVQTLFYLDFAWVYWSRQRVKLRQGGIIDNDDLRKGWLVNRFIDGRNEADNDDEEDVEAEGRHPPNGNGHQKIVNRWGNRGVSISADDTLAERDRRRSSGQHSPAPLNPNAGEEEEFLPVDNDEDEDVAAPQPHRLTADEPGVKDQFLNSGSEWRK